MGNAEVQALRKHCQDWVHYQNAELQALRKQNQNQNAELQALRKQCQDWYQDQNAELLALRKQCQDSELQQRNLEKLFDELNQRASLAMSPESSRGWDRDPIPNLLDPS